MHFTITREGIEMSPEDDFDRDVLDKLHKAARRMSGKLEITDGATTDQNWPSQDRETNIFFKLPD